MMLWSQLDMPIPELLTKGGGRRSVENVAMGLVTGGYRGIPGLTSSWGDPATGIETGGGLRLRPLNTLFGGIGPLLPSPEEGSAKSDKTPLISNFGGDGTNGFTGRIREGDTGDGLEVEAGVLPFVGE